MTWHVTTHSLITVGELGELLLVFQHDPTTHETKVAPPLILTPVPAGRSLEPNQAFICDRAFTGGRSREIDSFLQATLDCAWKRGLRPADFDMPQELRAVRAHLEDMRRLAGIEELPLPGNPPPAKPRLDEPPDGSST